MDLRYGENPHQGAAFYSNGKMWRKIQGKKLSYNNVLDMDCAIDCLREFDEPTCVIMKHASPCGIASASSIEKAWEDAYATDEYSPFGGVVGMNEGINEGMANRLSKIFLEVIIAPSFTNRALKIFSKKKKMRLLEIGFDAISAKKFRSVNGGILLQDRDLKKIDAKEWKVVTKKKPTKEQTKSLVFAVKCVKHVKSNAIVFVKGTAKGKKTVGIGSGQPSRIDASWIAVHKGKDRIRGSVMASDGFFPFRDAVDVAADAGVKAIAQPGGSVNDEKIIDAANERGIAMVFTRRRYFKH
jgi:phosphoribosylaminoimidazolecarboxamide formyltransferase/IMP cyclohydrolase